MKTLRLTSRLCGVAAVCVLALGVSPPAATRQPMGDDYATTLRLFNQRVGDYASLHHRLQARLPPLTSTRLTLRNVIARQLLADAIRNARPYSKQGDIFDPDVALMFRVLIVEALQGRDLEAFLAELNEEHPDVDAALLAVNEPLPRGASHAMPVALLQVFPELPEDIEYRIVDRDLVLWDIHANLVIDFLPKAFTRLETTLTL